MTKPCNKCGKEIKFEKENGNWIPKNLDGSPHKCQSQTLEKTTTPTIEGLVREIVRDELKRTKA